MADLTVTATRVALVESPRQPRSYPAGGTVTAGSPVYLDSNGKVQAAQADGTAAERTLVGLALSSVVTNEAVSIAGPDSIVDLGDAFTATAYGAAIYLSNTAGLIADAAGSVSVEVGRVIPAWSQTTPDKVIRVSGSLNGG